MTLDSTISRVQYTQGGATTDWPVPFRFLEASDLVVIQTQGDVDDILVLDTDYTVEIDGESGGTVTIDPAVSVGTRITIYRDIPLDQPVALSTAGGWYPEVHEDVFDRLAMQIQQVQDGVDRAVKLSATSTQNPDLVADQLLVARDEALSAANLSSNAAILSDTRASDAAASAVAAALSKDAAALSATAADLSADAAAASEAAALISQGAAAGSASAAQADAQTAESAALAAASASGATAWSAVTAYDVGDCVFTTDGKTYRAIAANTNVAPASDPTKWYLMTIVLGETSTTAYRGDRGKAAYDHSQTAHAPSNAQKNSDILKAEIEAKLTGANITSHGHSAEIAAALAALGDIFREGVFGADTTFTVAAADRGKVFIATNAFTITLPGAAAAGNGFAFAVYNYSAGNVTIAGAETINWLPSLVLAPNESAILVSSGYLWIALAKQQTISLPLTVANGGTSATTGVNACTNIGAVKTDHGHNVLGSFCFAVAVGSSTYAPGATIAGSSLRPAGVAGSIRNGSSGLSGTWRCLGLAGYYDGVNHGTLWQRVA